MSTMLSRELYHHLGTAEMEIDVSGVDSVP
jgi:hypothetical protein